MTERDFEQRLRDEFRQMVQEAAPPALRASVIAIPDRVAPTPERRWTARWRFPSFERFAPFALAAAVLVVAIVIGIGLVFRLSPTVGPTPIPAPTGGATPGPTPTATGHAAAAWTATGHMIEARGRHTATLLRDGRLLVAGGALNGNRGTTATAELYDPVSGTWTSTGNMNAARAGHTATLLRDGRVLVTGGNFGSPAGDFTAELYDPASGTWTVTGDMINTLSHYHTATLLTDGRVLVAGGGGGPNGLPTAELYDALGGTWSATGNLIENRDSHTATLLPDGRVLVAGERVLVAGAGTDFAELYDPTTGTWTATGTGNKTEARAFSTATLMPDGKVLVAGGWVVGDGGVQTLASAQLYDPSLGTWSSAGSMGVAREGHTATLLPDGIVLVVGGVDLSESFASAELYDPTSGTWTATANMDDARNHQTATLMPDGTVLVAGGYVGPDQSTVLASAELYDPGSGN